MNKSIILQKRPVGKPQLLDFKLVGTEMPEIQDAELLLKLKYVSVDPYLRGRMSDAKSYIEPFKLNEAMASGCIAEVIASKHESFQKGEFVSGMLEWKEIQASKGFGLIKVDNSKVPLTAYLGVLGMTGLTAYFGLMEIGRPKKGETLVVSGAAGAVGSVVGQIGKIFGCRVVGIAGSDKKLELLTSKFGFDEAINYNTSTNLNKDIAAACPSGVDVYFDNVGGNISDKVHMNINKFGRIVVCGAISTYNDKQIPVGPRVQGFLIKQSALMQGFIVGNYQKKFPEGMNQLAEWVKEGKINYVETIVEGFEEIPQAFIALFEGKNNGKMIVKVS